MSVLASFPANKSFNSGDLFEVSFVMTCKSLPKVSRQDRNKAYISLKWEEIVGKSRRYPVEKYFASEICNQFTVLFLFRKS